MQAVSGAAAEGHLSSASQDLLGSAIKRDANLQFQSEGCQPDKMCSFEKYNHTPHESLPATMPHSLNKSQTREPVLLTNSYVNNQLALFSISENLDSIQRPSGWFPSGKKPIGLKGGGPKLQERGETQLRLINNTTDLTTNICFVNSSIQLLKHTEIASFIIGQLPLSGSFTLCRALQSLLKERTSRERSAVLVRKLVADRS